MPSRKAAATPDELQILRELLRNALSFVECLLTAERSACPVSTERTLTDCLEKWAERRAAAKLTVREAHLREVRGTIDTFQRHSGVGSVIEIRRRHVLAYRDHLSTSSGYAVATINKKISFIMTLHGTAQNVGWVETSLGGKLLLALPEDQGLREPYSDDHLAYIFSHPIFTRRELVRRRKAGGVLQFWLPLISCTQGMISSEIVQLGPDTVVRHPNAPEIWCFAVTNAGGRRVKTLARRRWMPVRRELIDLGLLDVVENARRRESRHLWPALDREAGDVVRVSGYFSSFWADLSRRLGIESADGVSLYSFRHSFQDRLSRAGYGDDVKKALMGHAETGMTGRYGTKRAPREVDIAELNEAVQSLDWSFLGSICAPHR